MKTPAANIAPSTITVAIFEFHKPSPTYVELPGQSGGEVADEHGRLIAKSGRPRHAAGPAGRLFFAHDRVGRQPAAQEARGGADLGLGAPVESHLHPVVAGIEARIAADGHPGVR